MSRVVETLAPCCRPGTERRSPGLRWIGWSLLVGQVALLSSCASYRVSGLDKYENATGLVQQREAEGLYVAVHDLSSRMQSNRFFGRELASYGFVPVLLTLEVDKNADAAFDVNCHDMRLVLNNGERLETADAEEIAGAVAYSYWRSAPGFLFLIPGFFVVSSVTSANEELQFDYQEKSFESVRISSKHGLFRGVVFFAIPPQSTSTFDMEDAFVEVKVYKNDLEGELGKVLDLPIHFQD